MIFLVDFSSKCGIMINKRKVIELEKKFANLHVHSTHSDGAFSPKELVRLAKEEGYGAVAMTDHDTATGCDELKEEAAAAGLMSVMGVEFSCTAPELNANFHMVGFDFDPNEPTMKDFLRYLSEKETYITKLQFDSAMERGTLTHITWDEVVEANPGLTWFCNEPVFRTLIAKGLKTMLDYPEFFKDFRRPFPTPYQTPTAKETIANIRRAGGVPILAHGQHVLDRVPALMSYGLMGLEVSHHMLSESNETESANEIAAQYGLYRSGGSDHHGIMGGQQLRYPKGQNPFETKFLEYGVSETYFMEIYHRTRG
ncbi:MAG TPA: hypothetical protein DER23_04560 [Clostridiales bacterium]|jgi:hypothetical protein|nr:hypothetical protein [Clostridiales bacterium]HCG35598.1 hypothetical protein [Clostridiales bacterium]